jgi:type IV secretory pathway VirB2 component (pilin)
MAKLIAILNVVAWGGFWAFGYLALTAQSDQSGQMVMALILAFVGAAVGILAFFWLARHAEEIGYAKPKNRVVPEHLREEKP